MIENKKPMIWLINVYKLIKTINPYLIAHNLLFLINVISYNDFKFNLK